ncbi:translation initiation factor IF-3 [Candidatus Nomurabacteria bacterium]|nr:translation initiation factor IF-3 [Candidatus Nomurabacteria bacterium]USN94525.1 MAG: translation initiation factor IF-3 [Candidatus Nomurabacteria bacterium]
MRKDFRINKEIRAKELRVLDEEDNNLGTLSFEEALKMAEDRELDLIEIAPKSNPPVAKIADYGKFLYQQNKKLKKSKSGAKPTETKNIQIKVGTGDHDLSMKAKMTSEWLGEGHRVKVELFTRGRMNYMEKDFLKERLERILRYITVPYKISDEFKKSAKGYCVTIERDTSKKE